VDGSAVARMSQLPAGELTLAHGDHLSAVRLKYARRVLGDQACFASDGVPEAARAVPAASEQQVTAPRQRTDDHCVCMAAQDLNDTAAALHIADVHQAAGAAVDQQPAVPTPGQTRTAVVAPGAQLRARFQVQYLQLAGEGAVWCLLFHGNGDALASRIDAK